jgi:hypothetical protein
LVIAERYAEATQIVDEEDAFISLGQRAPRSTMNSASHRGVSSFQKHCAQCETILVHKQIVIVLAGGRYLTVRKCADADAKTLARRRCDN